MTEHFEKLQGAWKVVSLEVDGQTMPAGDAQVVISGGRFTTTGMGATYPGTVLVDANQTPHTLDMVFTEGPEKGNTNRGIFEIDGDTWKLCLNMTGGDRPTTRTRMGTSNQPSADPRGSRVPRATINP